jgi:hypothetical protein
MTNSSCPILRYLPSTCMAGPTENVKNRQSRIGDLRDEARSTWLELEHDRVPVPVLAVSENVQSAFYEKVPAGGCRLWCSAGGMCTGGWTKGLLLVESSMTHQGVTLLHTD